MRLISRARRALYRFLAVDAPPAKWSRDVAAGPLADQREEGRAC